MELLEIERIAKALADHNRLKLLQHMQHNQGKVAYADVAEILELSQPSISHHIKKLLDAKLILQYKNGRNCNYTLNHMVWENFFRGLEKL